VQLLVWPSHFFTLLVAFECIFLKMEFGIASTAREKWKAGTPSLLYIQSLYSPRMGEQSRLWICLSNSSKSFVTASCAVESDSVFDPGIWSVQRRCFLFCLVQGDVSCFLVNIKHHATLTASESDWMQASSQQTINIIVTLAKHFVREITTFHLIPFLEYA